MLAVEFYLRFLFVCICCNIIEAIDFFFNFIYFWLLWVFVAACGLSLVAVSRGYSLLHCAASHRSGFSCCGAQAPGTQASVVVACMLISCGSWALERRLSSCGTRA